MEQAKKKNGEIELARFLFAMLIVLHHYNNTFHSTKLLSRGMLGVEFFSVLSGYFLAKSISNNIQLDNNTTNLDLGSNTILYLWKMVSRFLPYYLISSTIVFCANCLYQHFFQIKEVIFLLFQSIPHLLLIGEIGFGNHLPLINAPIWYLSAMLFSVLVIYPICRRYFSMYTNVIAWILSLSFLGALNIYFGSLGGPFKIFLGGRGL